MRTTPGTSGRRAGPTGRDAGRRTVRRLVIAVLVCTVAAGCSGSDSGSPPQPTGGPGGTYSGPELPISVTKPTSGTGISLPLDAYVSTPKQRATVLRAEQVLVQGCMRDFGFDYPVPDYSGMSSQPWPDATRFLLFDADRAAQYGYRRPAGERPSGKQAGETNPPLSSAASAVFSGRGASRINGKDVPAGGCVGKAREKLGETPNLIATPLAQRLAGTAYTWSLNDARVRDVFAQWSSCMRRAGLAYRTPQDANGDPTWGEGAKDGDADGAAGAAQAPASGPEVTVARADVACKLETNTVGIWSAVVSAYQKKLIDDNAVALQEEKNAVRALIERAGTA
ncbi:hypothetical protein [Streptomyces sp. NPDC054961]